MISFIVEYVRASAPDRVWSRKVFPTRARARASARQRVGRPMGESGSIIIEARIYEHTLVDRIRGEDAT